MCVRATLQVVHRNLTGSESSVQLEEDAGVVGSNRPTSTGDVTMSNSVSPLPLVREDGE